MMVVRPNQLRPMRHRQVHTQHRPMQQQRWQLVMVAQQTIDRNILYQNVPKAIWNEFEDKSQLIGCEKVKRCNTHTAHKAHAPPHTHTQLKS